MARERDVLLRSISNCQLLLSAHDGCLDEVKKMVEGGKTDVTFTDFNGNTVLHWACQGRGKDVVDFLVSLPSIDLFKENRAMETALDVLYKNNTVSMECMKQALLKQAEEEIGAYAPKQIREKNQCVSEPSFLDETCASRFDCPYSSDDVKTVLTFLCPPISDENANDIAFDIEFPLPGYGTLHYYYCMREKETCFELSSHDSVIIGAQKLIPPELGSYDIVTQALFKVITITKNLREAKLEKATVEQVEQVIKKALTGTSLLKEKQLERERMFLAAIINEEKTTKEKIKKYSEFLVNVTKNYGDSTTKPAVCLLYFVELFACDDTFPEGKHIKLTKEAVRLLKKLKKEYYKRHYPDADLLNDITYLRTLLVHQLSSSRGLLQPCHLFEPSDANITCYSKHACLEYLQTFTQNVSSRMCSGSRSTKVQRQGENESFFRKFSSNLKGHIQKSIKPTDMFVYFCKKTQEFLKNAHDEVLYDLLFELIVNVGHQLGEYPMFKGFRNSVVHGFHHETVSGLQSKLPLLVRKMYIYQLAEKVGDVLLTMRGEEENFKLTHILTKRLEEMNKTFDEWPTSCVLSYGEEWWDNDSLERNVKIYVMCLSNLLDDASNDGDNILELDAKRVVCSDQIQIRSIFEDLLNLHRSYLKHPMPILEETLERALVTQFSLNRTEAADVICSVKSKKISETDENTTFCKEVAGIISSLGNLKHPHSVSSHTFVDNDVISLFNARKTGRSSHDFEDLLANYNLTEGDKDTVRDVLNKVHTQMQEREVLFSGKRVVLSVTSVVSHLLGLIKNMEPFPCKLDNLSEAFRDPLFLEYLSKMFKTVPNDLKYPKDFVEFRLCKVIRDIHSLDYAAPLVAKVLAETNETVVERQIVEKIIAVFLKTEDTISLRYLLGASNLLRLSSFNVMTKQNCSREQMTKILKCICPENMKVCFDLLTESQPTKVHNVLVAANDVIFDFLSDKKLKSCWKVIECAEELEIRAKQSVHKSVGLQRNLLKASCLQDLGLRSEKDRKENGCSETIDFYYETKEVLEDVLKKCVKEGVFETRKNGVLQRVKGDAMEYPTQGMLSLSKLAYNHYLLGKTEYYGKIKKQNIKKARYYSSLLVEEMLQYVGRSNRAYNHEDHCNITAVLADDTLYTERTYNIVELFKLVESSPKYQRLLELGKHYESKLKISRVYRDFLYYRLLLVDNSTKYEEKIKLMKEYDTFQKLSPPFLEMYFLKRKLQIIKLSRSKDKLRRLDLIRRQQYDELKSLELNITSLKLAIERYGSCSPTAEERFNSLESEVKKF